ncbi:hydrogenase nickel incorporation protein HypB [Campylobacter sp. MIT 21-1685]|uniref:hydrogenase nickel incorporation protein HypB n=1 Tax=unclassified Campylobacter TaxID=2593542 RepID=UPI00224A5A24|nr:MULTISPECIES: hydrogenase nickel incorporation protein HypB [unclassified Campylobacter]MCX2682274.1 hydrogenase nickel incorporation protein HypB [Campylobacter sp. MIT 21-1684]MCX2750554.1 hydrogenase nickel incorporation protein HypB [Campylobacter sp. MIT 21-1682]MCX2806898.1 hydrogenase nickel incorporation protein HypB [Campylobacter sp. MIT 21-1685]
MCKDCGCSINSHTHDYDNKHHMYDNPSFKEKKTLEVLSTILSKNEHQAAHNRKHFNEAKVLCINLMSSPGSGKTTLLEATIKALKNELNIAVIEGDLETNNDEKRIRQAGAKAYQITTGQSCHLDAFMIHKALHHLDIKDCDLLFIENVGNLVCPASYDLGEHLNVVLLSSTEGSDKPQKYPVMFRKADVVLITKSDVAQHFDFNFEEATSLVKELNPRADILFVDSKNGTNIQLWYKFLRLKKELF